MNSNSLSQPPEEEHSESAILNTSLREEESSYQQNSHSNSHQLHYHASSGPHQHAHGTATAPAKAVRPTSASHIRRKIAAPNSISGPPRQHSRQQQREGARRRGGGGGLANGSRSHSSHSSSPDVSPASFRGISVAAVAAAAEDGGHGDDGQPCGVKRKKSSAVSSPTVADPSLRANMMMGGGFDSLYHSTASSTSHRGGNNAAAGNTTSAVGGGASTTGTDTPSRAEGAHYAPMSAIRSRERGHSNTATAATATFATVNKKQLSPMPELSGVIAAADPSTTMHIGSSLPSSSTTAATAGGSFAQPPHHSHSHHHAQQSQLQQSQHSSQSIGNLAQALQLQTQSSNLSLAIIKKYRTTRQDRPSAEVDHPDITNPSLMSSSHSSIIGGGERVVGAASATAGHQQGGGGGSTAAANSNSSAAITTRESTLMTVGNGSFGANGTGYTYIPPSIAAASHHHRDQYNTNTQQQSNANGADAEVPVSGGGAAASTASIPALSSRSNSFFSLKHVMGMGGGGGGGGPPSDGAHDITAASKPMNATTDSICTLQDPPTGSAVVGGGLGLGENCSLAASSLLSTPPIASPTTTVVAGGPLDGGYTAALAREAIADAAEATTGIPPRQAQEEEEEQEEGTTHSSGYRPLSGGIVGSGSGQQQALPPPIGASLQTPLGFPPSAGTTTCSGAPSTEITVGSERQPDSTNAEESAPKREKKDNEDKPKKKKDDDEDGEGDQSQQQQQSSSGAPANVLVHLVGDDAAYITRYAHYLRQRREAEERAAAARFHRHRMYRHAQQQEHHNSTHAMALKAPPPIVVPSMVGGGGGCHHVDPMDASYGSLGQCPSQQQLHFHGHANTTPPMAPMMMTSSSVPMGQHLDDDEMVAMHHHGHSNQTPTSPANNTTMSTSGLTSHHHTPHRGGAAHSSAAAAHHYGHHSQHHHFHHHNQYDTALSTPNDSTTEGWSNAAYNTTPSMTAAMAPPPYLQQYHLPPRHHHGQPYHYQQQQRGASQPTPGVGLADSSSAASHRRDFSSISNGAAAMDNVRRRMSLFRSGRTTTSSAATSVHNSSTAKDQQAAAGPHSSRDGGASTSSTAVPVPTATNATSGGYRHQGFIFDHYTHRPDGSLRPVVRAMSYGDGVTGRHLMLKSFDRIQIWKMAESELEERFYRFASDHQDYCDYHEAMAQQHLCAGVVKSTADKQKEKKEAATGQGGGGGSGGDESADPRATRGGAAGVGGGGLGRNQNTFSTTYASMNNAINNKAATADGGRPTLFTSGLGARMTSPLSPSGGPRGGGGGSFSCSYASTPFQNLQVVLLGGTNYTSAAPSSCTVGQVGSSAAGGGAIGEVEEMGSDAHSTTNPPASSFDTITGAATMWGGSSPPSLLHQYPHQQHQRVAGPPQRTAGVSNINSAATGYGHVNDYIPPAVVDPSFAADHPRTAAGLLNASRQKAGGDGLVVGPASGGDARSDEALSDEAKKKAGDATQAEHQPKGTSSNSSAAPAAAGDLTKEDAALKKLWQFIPQFYGVYRVGGLEHDPRGAAGACEYEEEQQRLGEAVEAEERRRRSAQNENGDGDDMGDSNSFTNLCTPTLVPHSVGGGLCSDPHDASRSYSLSQQLSASRPSSFPLASGGLSGEGGHIAVEGGTLLNHAAAGAHHHVCPFTPPVGGSDHQVSLPSSFNDDLPHHQQCANVGGAASGSPSASISPRTTSPSSGGYHSLLARRTRQVLLGGSGAPPPMALHPTPPAAYCGAAEEFPPLAVPPTAVVLPITSASPHSPLAPSPPPLQPVHQPPPVAMSTAISGTGGTGPNSLFYRYDTTKGAAASDLIAQFDLMKKRKQEQLAAAAAASQKALPPTAQQQQQFANSANPSGGGRRSVSPSPAASSQSPYVVRSASAALVGAPLVPGGEVAHGGGSRKASPDGSNPAVGSSLSLAGTVSSMLSSPQLLTVPQQQQKIPVSSSYSNFPPPSRVDGGLVAVIETTPLLLATRPATINSGGGGSIPLIMGASSNSGAGCGGPLDEANAMAIGGTATANNSTNSSGGRLLSAADRIHHVPITNVRRINSFDDAAVNTNANGSGMSFAGVGSTTMTTAAPQPLLRHGTLEPLELSSSTAIAAAAAACSGGAPVLLLSPAGSSFGALGSNDDDGSNGTATTAMSPTTESTTPQPQPPLVSIEHASGGSNTHHSHNHSEAPFGTASNTYTNNDTATATSADVPHSASSTAAQIAPEDASAVAAAVSTKMIVFEDVCRGMRYSCVLDLKMGPRQYGIGASEKKMASKNKKAMESTSWEYGVRLGGLKMYVPGDVALAAVPRSNTTCNNSNACPSAVGSMAGPAEEGSKADEEAPMSPVLVAAVAAAEKESGSSPTTAQCSTFDGAHGQPTQTSDDTSSPAAPPPLPDMSHHVACMRMDKVRGRALNADQLGHILAEFAGAAPTMCVQLTTVDFTPAVDANAPPTPAETAAEKTDTTDPATTTSDGGNISPPPPSPATTTTTYTREQIHELRALRSNQLHTLLVAELKRFRRAFASQDSFRFFTSSLLIAVDALDLLVGAESEVRETIQRHEDIIAAYEDHRRHRIAVKRIRAQQQREGRDRRRQRAEAEQAQELRKKQLEAEDLRERRRSEKLNQQQQQQQHASIASSNNSVSQRRSSSSASSSSASSSSSREAGGSDGYASDCSTASVGSAETDVSYTSSCSSCSYSDGEDCGIGHIPLEPSATMTMSGAAGTTAAAPLTSASLFPHRRHRHNPLKDLFNVKVRMIDFAFTYAKETLLKAGDADGLTTCDGGYLLGVDSLIKLLKRAKAEKEAEQKVRAYLDTQAETGKKGCAT